MLLSSGIFLFVLCFESMLLNLATLPSLYRMQFIDNLISMGYAGRHIIINRLRMYRREKGYTQAFVATLLGLRNKSEISRWEQGITRPSLENLFKLSIIYGRLTEDLYREFYKEIRHDLEENMHRVASTLRPQLQ